MTDDADRGRVFRNRLAWGLVVVGFFALIGAFLFIVLDSAMDTVDRKTADQVLTPRQLEFLLHDYTAVAALDMLEPPTTRSRNAGPVLGPYVAPFTDRPLFGGRAPQTLKARMSGEHINDWITDPESLAKYDPAFWPDLPSFDHLELTGHGPWGAYIADDGARFGPDGAHPFFYPLVAAAKIRWSAALTGAVPVETALADTRGLARLLASEGSWWAIESASEILGLEEGALIAAGHLPGASSLKALSSDQADAPRRVLAGTRMVLTGRAPANALEQLRGIGAVASGLACPAVPGALELDWIRRSLLHPPTVFEPDHAELFYAARALAVDCGLTDLMATLDAQPPLSLLEVKSMGYPFATGPAATPGFRSLMLRAMIRGGIRAPKNPYTDR